MKAGRVDVVIREVQTNESHKAFRKRHRFALLQHNQWARESYRWAQRDGIRPVRVRLRFEPIPFDQQHFYPRKRVEAHVQEVRG